jgi:DNA-binding response OmpR family regulator
MAQAFSDDKSCIFIIEKDAHTAHLLDYLLSREGYDIVVATNCASALLQMRKMLSPSIIFLGLPLAIESNQAMLKHIRSMPGWITTPVVILAENYAYQDIDIAMEFGANDYIMLPFNPAELLTHIHRRTPMT